MSNRFFSLCLAILIISNIYFYNYALYGRDFSNQEIYIGIFLNQSIHLFLMFYLLYRKNIKIQETKTKIVLLVLGLDIANEVFNIGFKDFQYSHIIDSSIVGLQRLGWTALFVVFGGKLVSTIKAKNILNLAFASFMVYSFFAGFGYSISNALWVFFLFFILCVFVSIGSNTDSRYFHAIGLGALLIAVGDLAFIYSGFHGDYEYRYLYLLPRIIINLGELLIVYRIFREK